MSVDYFEVNFDGIAGPTHNYSGLAYGNQASMQNKHLFSHPKEAALQCLQKMKFMSDLGLIQGIIPPQERPFLPLLRDLGFSGKDQEVIEKAHKQAPRLFYACCSSSFMWAANAATFTPSSDSLDGRAHFTPANLSAELHRCFEGKATEKFLRKIFSDETLFHCHTTLPAGKYFSDEGAANQTRFCQAYGDSGLHLFVYGKSHLKPWLLAPVKYPARQTLEASEAIARRHNLPPDHAIFVQQHPAAIDAGIFHNDVISVGNKYVFFYHENAFVETETVIRTLDAKMKELCHTEMLFIRVSEEEIPLEEVVKTYLFNSQLVSIDKNHMAIIAPSECRESCRVRDFLDKLAKDPANPIQSIYYLNITESMQNGGGPACLRLRLTLSQPEIQALHQGVLLSEQLYKKLKDWVERHYRDRLSPKELVDPELLIESRQALHELSRLLEIEGLYSF